MSHRDISGDWAGHYSYPAGLGPSTPFLAVIRDDGGRLSGHVVEPNLMGRSGAHLNAVISGARADRAIDFTKVYDGAGDAAHAVDYSGHLSEDGMTITGIWSLGTMDGRFEMRREDGGADAATRKAEEEVRA